MFLPVLAILFLFIQGPSIDSDQQEPQSIRAGESIKGKLAKDDPFLEGRGHSKQFVLRVEEDGNYTIGLDSYDFYAFLLIRDK